ncbi:MAG: oxygen-dependent coproporphyrinogen oxidase [Planctomycetota bacterium]
MPAQPHLDSVRDYLQELQDLICAALEEADSRGRFHEDRVPRERGGLSRTRVLSDGQVLERAAVNFSHTVGDVLPGPATERRPELTGCRFQAVSLSLIVHPQNPYVPTTHVNLRFFMASGAAKEPTWWFGGGFDLTPTYGFREDAVHWHRVAREACAPFGELRYGTCKKACDEYFYLKHRKEARGIGGIFFDDLVEGGFAHCFSFVKSVGDHFLDAYLPILRRRKDHPFGNPEREFQLYRRGRYVEFNLIYDRGTRYGLESGGGIESILVSLPPRVSWRYDWQPLPGSRESQLTDFLKPRDWLEGEPD